MNPRRPHVCFVAPNAYPLLAKDANLKFSGGAELQQVLIARELVGRGYEVSMVTLDFGQDDGCVIDGITVFQGCKPKAGVPVLRFLWPRITSIWGAMKRANADIYYQRTASMLTGIVAAYCRQHGRKSVFAVAGETSIRFRRDLWLFEYGLARVDRIVVQNAAQASRLHERVGREVVLIPNIFQPVNQKYNTSSRKILWVGMIRQVKRPDLFLDIVESLPELSFVMVGGESIGERELYRLVSKRAAGLTNLEFPGFVPLDQIDPYFDDAAVLVNTSDSEGFPNTFLQAWARGVPTVSFVDSGGRLDGAIVGLRAKSSQEMANMLCALMEDQAWRRKLGEDCRQYANLEHAPERVLDRYERLFKDLHGSPAARSKRVEERQG